MADFKIRLSEKSTDILKELGPRLFSDVGAGASIENKKRQLAKKDRFEKNETGKKEEVQQVTIQQVPLDAIVDSPYQCRGSYSTTAIEEIAHSIKEIGLRQIPEARKVGTNGTFQLAYGHMRFRAFKKLAKTDKTITTMPLDVKEISDDTMCLISLEENIRRQDITPIDIARAVELYMATFKEATETELARRLKMTQGHVSNMRRVLRLPAEILTKIEEGKNPAYVTARRKTTPAAPASGVIARSTGCRKEAGMPFHR
ncbi:MAG: ParB/RepB/Spo0J family partition protein [Dehalococcoidales bacterium]|nr:ParB/RepB/Spo0J family partition protein [Dehalococcoidales bacterium]